MDELLEYMCSLDEFSLSDIDEAIMLDEKASLSRFIFTFRIFPLVCKRWFTGGGFGDDMIEHMKRIVKKARTPDDIKYLRQDANAARGQLAQLLKNVEGYEKDPEGYEDVLASSFKREICSGKINSKDLKKYIRWVETEYPKLLTERLKEIKEGSK